MSETDKQSVILRLLYDLLPLVAASVLVGSEEARVEVSSSCSLHGAKAHEEWYFSVVVLAPWVQDVRVGVANVESESEDSRGSVSSGHDDFVAVDAGRRARCVPNPAGLTTCCVGQSSRIENTGVLSGACGATVQLRLSVCSTD